jgi:hypothetical protein
MDASRLLEPESGLHARMRVEMKFNLNIRVGLTISAKISDQPHSPTAHGSLFA